MTLWEGKPFKKLTWLDKVKVKASHFLSIMRAQMDVKKDFIIYYLPVKFKLKR